MKCILALFSIIFFSCGTTRTLDVIKIPKNSKLTVIKDHLNERNGTRETYLYFHKLSEKEIGVINIDKNSITLDVQLKTNKSDSLLVDGSSIPRTSKNKWHIPSLYEYSGLIKDNLNDNVSSCLYLNKDTLIGGNYILIEHFKYRSSGRVSQAVTIPFKFRFPLDINNDGDIDPYQLSTGINVGYAVGYKWNRHAVQPIFDIQEDKPKMMGYDQRLFSYTVAPFFGPTTIALDENNTYPAINTSRTIFGFNAGGLIAFGLNRFNLGAAIGFDFGLGDKAGDWAYNGRPWWGVVLGLDFFK